MPEWRPCVSVYGATVSLRHDSTPTLSSLLSHLLFSLFLVQRKWYTLKSSLSYVFRYNYTNKIFTQILYTKSLTITIKHTLYKYILALHVSDELICERWTEGGLFVNEMHRGWSWTACACASCSACQLKSMAATSSLETNYVPCDFYMYPPSFSSAGQLSLSLWQLINPFNSIISYQS